jgi:hypothetical protein
VPGARRGKSLAGLPGSSLFAIGSRLRRPALPTNHYTEAPQNRFDRAPACPLLGIDRSTINRSIGRAGAWKERPKSNGGGAGQPACERPAAPPPPIGNKIRLRSKRELMGGSCPAGRAAGCAPARLWCFVRSKKGTAARLPPAPKPSGSRQLHKGARRHTHTCM